jgi:hypothetical protein
MSEDSRCASGRITRQDVSIGATSRDLDDPHACIARQLIRPRTTLHGLIAGVTGDERLHVIFHTIAIWRVRRPDQLIRPRIDPDSLVRCSGRARWRKIAEFITRSSPAGRVRQCVQY